MVASLPQAAVLPAIPAYLPAYVMNPTSMRVPARRCACVRVGRSRGKPCRPALKIYGVRWYSGLRGIGLLAGAPVQRIFLAAHGRLRAQNRLYNFPTPHSSSRMRRDRVDAKRSDGTSCRVGAYHERAGLSRTHACSMQRAGERQLAGDAGLRGRSPRTGWLTQAHHPPGPVARRILTRGASGAAVLAGAAHKPP